MLVLLDTGVLLRLFVVAQMVVWNVATILTLNAADFRRYPGIVVQTPAELLAVGSTN